MEVSTFSALKRERARFEVQNARGEGEGGGRGSFYNARNRAYANAIISVYPIRYDIGEHRSIFRAVKHDTQWTPLMV